MSNMHKRNHVPQEFAAKASLDLLDPALADDIEQSVRTALKSGAVFRAASDLDSIFRDAVAEAITDIEERASLLRRFLIDGPYERDGDIPLELRGKRLNDEETDKAVAFIYSHVVNSFQGRLAELLAVGSCAELAGKLIRERQISATARLYIGDAVLLSDTPGGVRRKAADMHLISIRPGRDHKAVIGVVEVKSYPCPPKRLQGQLDQHITRIRKGAILTLSNEKGKCSEHVAEPAKQIFRIGVTPSTWKLPRTFSFKKSKGRTLLHTDTPVLPNEWPLIEKVGVQDWHVVLKWSQEALASNAYEMSFWYMEQLGEMLYCNAVPREWSEMTPAEAGRNAAKMMLYYAILRCTNSRSQQRAIALYNSYGFGYAIGMNFRDAQGRREMLWPEDLHEISKTGVTKHGCRIAL